MNESTLNDFQDVFAKDAQLQLQQQQQQQLFSSSE